MRIFAFEYVTAGGARECAAPASLIAEGTMMLRALAGDLSRLSGVEVSVARDPAIALGHVGGDVRTIDPANPWAAWGELIADCDAVWPIAPESGGILEEVTALAERHGRAVLNSRRDALAVACSKHATTTHLARAGAAVAATALAGGPPPAGTHGWVVKPDDGAGSVDTHFLSDRAALARWQAKHPRANFVVQEFVPGPTLSLSTLMQDGACWLLSCNVQDVRCEGGAFVYRGGTVAGAEARRRDLEPLAARIAAALPGLWGHVGIDVVDGPAGPVVIEINPRVTTSYVGLAESIGLNPAALVLALREQSLGALSRTLMPKPVDVFVPRA
ncbi:MAG TPA: ATP-grasp domain-containing protein [Stellaceae bacterium]|nr:ATP-grasp domain-containing protein [Stellaceae bacterium]